jgi:hypothetical protein
VLRRVAKRLRTRAAVVLAVLYASCVIAPPLTLAFTDGASAAHCLTDDHHGVNVQHTHGAVHLHHDDGALGQNGGHGNEKSDNKTKSDNCCGLFCVTAGAVPSVAALTGPDHATAMDVVLDDTLGGRLTDRIDRPPRASLSL